MNNDPNRLIALMFTCGKLFSTVTLDMLRTSHILALFGLLTACASAQPPGQRMSAEEYISLWQEVAVRNMNTHGIPASITLAQGLLESGNGNSELARTANNHFGIKCHSDWKGKKVYYDDDRRHECFRKYKDASQSYEDHSAFLQRTRYEDLFTLRTTDYKGWAHGLKRAGYATDPRYPQKLIDLIERYRLHELDKGNIPVAGHPSPKPKRNSSATDEVVVNIGAGRQIEVHDNRIKFVRARNGDSLERIARDLEMTTGMLARWNDLEKHDPVKEDQVIFMQPKRNKAKGSSEHTVMTGQTLWDISQQHGVKLSKLADYNGLSENDTLSAGQRIMLKKPKR